MEKMKYLYIGFFIIIFQFISFSQSNQLFDDKVVNEIYVEIPTDTLAKIYSNPLSENYSNATFIFGKDTIKNVGFRLRGNSSRYSKKKSFKISFNEFVSGTKYQGVKKINLNGQHNDPSLIREKLFYDTWKKGGFPERRSAFVRVFINKKYYGLYTLLEEYDKDWLTRVFGENDGNLYKCTYPADLKYIDEDQNSYKKLFNTTTTGGRVYDLKTNETADDYTDLVKLIATANIPINQAFADSIQKVLDVNWMLKAFAMDVAMGNWDDFFYNKNNYFLYNAADHKFKFITYDTDNTAGIDFLNVDWATRNCLNWYQNSIPLPPKLMSVPSFKFQFAKYLDIIARNLIAPSVIFPKIDSMKTLIRSSVMQDSFRKLDYGFDSLAFEKSFVGKVISFAPYGVKPFFETRYNKILEQLSVILSLENDLEHQENEVKIYPNPTNDFLYFNSSQKIISIIIYNEIGQEIKRVNSVSENKIDLSNLKSGLYIIKFLNMNNEKIVKKVLKN